MHLEIYSKRDDVEAIVHTHPPYATGFSFTDKKIPRFEGFGEIKAPYIAEIEYAVPGSLNLVESASDGLINEDVLLLRNHGVVTVVQIFLRLFFWPNSQKAVPKQGL